MKERTRILELLAQGKISVDEAERLLEAVKTEERTADGVRAEDKAAPAEEAGKPRFLCVVVNKAGGEAVNIRVPLGLLRAGLKLKGLLPADARADIDVALKEKGLQFNVDELDGKSLDEIVQVLRETSITVDGKGEQLRICCE